MATYGSWRLRWPLPSGIGLNENGSGIFSLGLPASIVGMILGRGPTTILYLRTDGIFWIGCDGPDFENALGATIPLAPADWHNTRPFPRSFTKSR